MGVVIAISNNEEIYLDRMLNQLRVMRGDQTDRPLVSVVNRITTDHNLTVLKQRHPLVNFRVIESAASFSKHMTDLFDAALTTYPSEEYFLWAAPRTFFVQPPRIQVATGLNVAAISHYWVNVNEVYHNEHNYKVPVVGYVVMHHKVVEKLLRLMLDKPAMFDQYHYRRYLPERLTDELCYCEVYSAFLGRGLSEIGEYMDASLRNQVSEGNYLTAKDFTRIAQLNNLRNL